jgi:hypothetical protein
LAWFSSHLQDVSGPPKSPAELFRKSQEIQALRSQMLGELGQMGAELVQAHRQRVQLAGQLAKLEKQSRKRKGNVDRVAVTSALRGIKSDAEALTATVESMGVTCLYTSINEV